MEDYFENRNIGAGVATLSFSPLEDTFRLSRLYGKSVFDDPSTLTTLESDFGYDSTVQGSQQKSRKRKKWSVSSSEDADDTKISGNNPRKKQKKMTSGIQVTVEQLREADERDLKSPSVSLVDLKLNLVQSLKKIRATDYTIQFCTLLIEAENSNYKAVNADRFINKLREINKHDQIDIVKVLLEVLHAHKSGSSCDLEVEHLSLFFDRMKNPAYKCSVESLISSSKTVKKLMELYCNTNLYCSYTGEIVEEPEKTLVVLKQFLLEYLGHEVFAVLCTMFEIGRYDLTYTIPEKKEITSLLFENFNHLYNFIKHFVSDHRYRLGIIDLQLRSSLQFMSDNFAELLTDKHVAKEIKSIKTILDNLISSWCEEKNADQNLDDEVDNLDDEVDDFFDEVEDLEYEIDSSEDRIDDSEDEIDDSEEDLKHLLDEVEDLEEFSDCGDYIDCSEENERDLFHCGFKNMPKHHTWWDKYYHFYFKK